MNNSTTRPQKRNTFHGPSFSCVKPTRTERLVNVCHNSVNDLLTTLSSLVPSFSLKTWLTYTAARIKAGNNAIRVLPIFIRCGFKKGLEDFNQPEIKSKINHPITTAIAKAKTIMCEK